MRGQATLEYALLIATAALLGLSFHGAFQGIVGQGMLAFNAVLERELTSGNFAEAFNGWEN